MNVGCCRGFLYLRFRGGYSAILNVEPERKHMEKYLSGTHYPSYKLRKHSSCEITVHWCKKCWYERKKRDKHLGGKTFP